MKKVLKAAVLLLVAVSFVTCNSLLWAAPKEVRLRFSWWGGEARHKDTLAAIEVYVKKNPNVKIAAEYSGWDGYQQKLLTQLAGGNAPDIIQLDQPWLADLMAQGDLFLDLNKYKSSINMNGFDKKFLADLCTVNRKLVGLPTGINAATFAVNTTLAAKLGIPAATVWNWDNLAEIGAKVHKQDSGCYLLQTDLRSSMDLIKAYVGNKTGKPWLTADYAMGFNKQQLAEAFTYFRKLIENGTIEPFEESMLFDKKMEQDPKWTGGKVVMNLNWASSMEIYKRPNFQMGIMRPAFAKGAKNTGLIVRPAQVIGINSRTAQPKEAAKFVNWFFNDPEAIAILGMSRGVPPTEIGRQTLAAKNLLEKTVADAVSVGLKNAGIPETPATNNSEIVNIFSETVQKVGFGKITPQKAADELIAQFQAKLNELKNQK